MKYLHYVFALSKSGPGLRQFLYDILFAFLNVMLYLIVFNLKKSLKLLKSWLIYPINKNRRCSNTMHSYDDLSDSGIYIVTNIFTSRSGRSDVEIWSALYKSPTLIPLFPALALLGLMLSAPPLPTTFLLSMFVDCGSFARWQHQLPN